MRPVKMYVRVAATSRGYRFAATSKPSLAPLYDANADPLPTIAFALALDIDPQAFRTAEAVLATITVPPDVPLVAAELVR